MCFTRQRLIKPDFERLSVYARTGRGVRGNSVAHRQVSDVISSIEIHGEQSGRASLLCMYTKQIPR